jgi:hypothetical protein
LFPVYFGFAVSPPIFLFPPDFFFSRTFGCGGWESFKFSLSGCPSSD